MSLEASIEVSKAHTIPSSLALELGINEQPTKLVCFHFSLLLTSREWDSFEVCALTSPQGRTVAWNFQLKLPVSPSDSLVTIAEMKPKQAATGLRSLRPVHICSTGANAI